MENLQIDHEKLKRCTLDFMIKVKWDFLRPLEKLYAPVLVTRTHW